MDDAMSKADSDRFNVWQAVVVGNAGNHVAKQEHKNDVAILHERGATDPWTVWGYNCASRRRMHH